MLFPLSTLQVADLLGISEGQLTYLIRSRKFMPPEPVRGRRSWYAEHVLAAAEAGDLMTDRVRKVCGLSVGAA